MGVIFFAATKKVKTNLPLNVYGFFEVAVGNSLL
jgi:hypothetical protein